MKKIKIINHILDEKLSSQILEPIDNELRIPLDLQLMSQLYDRFEADINNQLMIIE